jgi:anti-sigma regulatory factor (Ser/Thr protein kinase)
VDPHLDDSPHVAARDVGRLVEEAISNAVRHGGASNISVRVSLNAGGAVSVTVEDDGVNEVQHAAGDAHQAGVGSAMFDQITGGQWTLTRHNGTTQFIATLPASHRQ